MSATPDELERVWTLLSPGDARPLTALRVPNLPPAAAVYLAIDSQRARSVLVECAGFEKVPTKARTKALDVRYERHSVSGFPEQDFLALHCRDARFQGLFVRLAAEIAEVARATQGEGCAPAQVLAVVERWRRFWGVDPSLLSRERAIGLLGELWFMDRWLGVRAAAIDAWAGPDDERHDFALQHFSVEVKTCTRASGPTLHDISSLSQLEPPIGRPLYLFSLRLREERLATTTLPGLVASVRGALSTMPVALDYFEEKLLQWGYTPASASEHAGGWHVLAQHLFSVRSDFPSLKPALFVGGQPPPTVSAVRYTLDVSGCNPWCVASTPFEGQQFLRTDRG